MEVKADGSVRRRVDDNDSMHLHSPSPSNNPNLAKRLDSRTYSQFTLNDFRNKRDEDTVRLRGKSLLHIFALVQILFLASFIFVYFLNDDINLKLTRNKCSLPFGDTILLDNNGYSLIHHNGLALFTRVENKSILYPESCMYNVTVPTVSGEEQIFHCLSQTFLFHNNRPYYAFRLFRPYLSHRKNENAVVEKNDILVQGPFSKSCGDWIAPNGCLDVQLVIRTDLQTGRITLGYPPVPVRRKEKFNDDEDVTLYVDGSALVMTSLNRRS